MRACSRGKKKPLLSFATRSRDTGLSLTNSPRQCWTTSRVAIFGMPVDSGDAYGIGEVLSIGCARHTLFESFNRQA
jgi:hypothetical protein